MKKIIGLTLIFVFAVIAVGCKKKSNDLKIAVYLGGYGQKWINTIAEKFMEANPEVKIEIEANPDLQADIPGRLTNGSDDDIFFSHGISWERLAIQKLIEPLDDIMEQEVENGIKLKDKINPSLLETAKFNNKYYKLPWTNGVGGIIYNAKMFRENNWEVPETYEDLMSLGEKIFNANIKVDPTDSKPNAATIKPFVWSQETYYWDYVVFDWWAQLAGVEFFKEYTKITSPEAFNPTKSSSHYKALEAWANLVAKNPLWSMEDSVGKQHTAAQMDFINGYAAMIPNAQWLESEMSANLDPEKVEMAIMPTPFLADAKKDENGNPIRVNYTVGAGDSIIIPAKSKNKELAKKFLLFLAKDESIKTFTEQTQGVLLAMNYDNVDFSNSNLSGFAQSVIEISKNSQRFNLYSNSLLSLEGKIRLEWPVDNIQHYASLFNHYNNREYIRDPQGWLDKGNEKSVIEIFEKAYNYIVENWDRFNSEIEG